MQKWMVSESKSSIGLNLIEMQDYEKSIQYFTQQIESDADNSELYFWRGRSYREAALSIKRQNNHHNTEKSLSYFQKSNDDHKTALELHAKDQ